MRPGPASVLTLALLTASVAGVGVGAALTAPGTPDLLTAGETLTQAPVTTRDFTDQRSLALRLSPGDSRSVTVRGDGYLTGSSCVAGGTLDSGTSTFSVDGAGLLSLHTTEPLWRDLSIGDTGSDVAALNESLRALGHDAPTGDRATAATWRAYRAARVAAGLSAPAAGATIDHDQVVWLPERTVTVDRCAAAVGTDVAAGDALAELPTTVDRAALVSVPADGTPGDRVLTVDGVEIPVEADGRVTDPDALSWITSSQAYVEAAAGSEAGADVTLTVAWSLLVPLQVWVVPPGSVVGAGSETVCVRDTDDRVVPVTVTGSELGQTYVVPADPSDAQPAAVQLDPATGCDG
jgi:hypothetical protein